MAKVVTENRLDQLRRYPGEIAQLREQLATKIRERNRDVVDAVDEGWPQDRVAAAIEVGPTAVTKILATTEPPAPPPVGL
jgi:hypothetical protein